MARLSFTCVLTLATLLVLPAGDAGEDLALAFDFPPDDGEMSVIDVDDIRHTRDVQFRQRQFEGQADEEFFLELLARCLQIVLEDIGGKGAAQGQAKLGDSDRRQDLFDGARRGEVRMSEQVKAFLEINMLSNVTERSG